MSRLLEFKDKRLEATVAQHFPKTQLPLDVVFNIVLSAVTFSSSVKFISQFPPLDKIAYLKHMRHFMGWPGAKAALGMSGLSACTATRAVWTTLQVELAFVLPLCAVHAWELSDRQRFVRQRKARLPAARDAGGLGFTLEPVAARWRCLLWVISAVAPPVVLLAAR